MWLIFHSEISLILVEKFSPKMFSVSCCVVEPISILLAVTAAGSSWCKLPFKTTEKDDKEEGTVSVAAAQVLSELENISPLKEERHKRLFSAADWLWTEFS